MGYAKILVPCLILLASCGGGGLFSGFGFSDCSSWRGMWAGSATSDNGHPSGIINLTITQKKDSCNVVGSVAFQPCVPVTAIGGKTKEGFIIETIDGALILGTPRLRSDQKETDVAKPPPVGQTRSTSYTFTNVNNVSNCPASDTGTVELTKTG